MSYLLNGREVEVHFNLHQVRYCESVHVVDTALFVDDGTPVPEIFHAEPVEAYEIELADRYCSASK